MITLRKSRDRGYFDHGWLETYHSAALTNADFFSLIYIKTNDG